MNHINDYGDVSIYLLSSDNDVVTWVEAFHALTGETIVHVSGRRGLLIESGGLKTMDKFLY